MSARPSIIVCDDEVELADEIGEFFSASGWKVLVCGAAAEVREALSRGFAPACLLTDLRLGDGFGCELVAFAKALPEPLRPTVTALITGHAATSDAVGCAEADFVYFKPVDPYDILTDLDRARSEGVAAAPPAEEDRS